MSESTTEISSINDLDKIRDNPEGHFILKKDIVFSDKSEATFHPIETFEGTLDGQGNKIEGLKISSGECQEAALVIKNDGVLKNIQLKNVSICGKFSAAGLVVSNNSVVKNCSCHGKIENKSNNSGGICSNNSEEGVLANCSFDGNVEGSKNVGGIVGKSEGIVRDCHSSGLVEGSNKVGGVVGSQFYTESREKVMIKSCHSDATVIGSYQYGGVVGLNSSIIEDCYYYGEIAPSHGNSPFPTAGTLVGENRNTIKNSYWTKEVEMGEEEASPVGKGEMDSSMEEIEDIGKEKNIRSIKNKILVNKI